MNKGIKLGLLLLAFVGMTGFVHAQKLGYINSATLLSEMPEVKQADSNLDALQKQLQKKGQQKLESLQQKYQDLRRKEDQGELSPKQLQEEAEKLKGEEVELAKYEQDMQKQLLEKREELLQPIIDRVNKSISDIAKEQGFSYIFDSSAGFLLYADETQDITAQVKGKLGL